MLLSGVLDLPWWGYVVAALLLTHATILSVTIYLHRCQAHRGLDLHPVLAHAFRLWLWLTTGMITKEWAAIHRKHHAKCETEDDPHSPQVFGINKVLWGGVMLYVKESHNRETIEKFGHGTPDDWIERKLYTPWQKWGIVLMAVIDIALFGLVPGLLIFGVQMAWIPFWAAGVINGVGHWWGYRNYNTDDASRNISPWGILIGGEELHNNHHAYPTSARFSTQWYELDWGWLWIRVFSALGLAKVRRVAPRRRFGHGKPTCDETTLDAVITHRYEVLTAYARSLRATCAAEMRAIAARAPSTQTAQAQARMASKRIRAWLSKHTSEMSVADLAAIREHLAQSKVLTQIATMRDELVAIWQRSSLSRAELAAKLEDWCKRAEASGIEALEKFSGRIRRYA